MNSIRTLLIQPVIVIDETNPKKYIFQPGNEIPLNSLCLSAFLNQEKLENDFMDMRVSWHPWKSLDTKVREFQPRVAGLTACTCEILGAHKVAESIKRIDSSIITVIGGVQASAMPEQVLKEYPCFDVAAFGEGEFTLAELIRSASNGTDFSAIQGIAYRKNGTIQINDPRPLAKDIDIFPLPNRKLIDIRKYYPNVVTYNYHNLPTTGIIASRGCKYNCFHCTKSVWGTGARYCSAQRIFSEILDCIHHHGVRDFRFYDDVMTLPEGPLEELCHLLIDNKVKITFNCYSRIDHITFEMLKLMKRAGCCHIKFGIESSSKKALDISNRNTTDDMARNAIEMTRKAGILVKGTFMMGMPGEVITDFENTIELAKKLKPDLASFGLFTLFPGSRLYREIALEGNEDLKKSILDPERVLPFISKGYREFYFTKGFILRRLKFLAANPDTISTEVKRFIRGSLTLIWFFFRRLLKNA